MAMVIEKRTDGTAVVVLSAPDAVKLKVGATVGVRPSANVTDLPWPFGALAGKYPPFEIGEIKAARREALGEAE